MTDTDGTGLVVLVFLAILLHRQNEFQQPYQTLLDMYQALFDVFLRSGESGTPTTAATETATQTAARTPSLLDNGVRFVRFVTVRTRNPNENCVQLSQIALFANNRRLRLRGAANPGGHNPPNEGPSQIGDRRAFTKWLDFRKRPLVLELSERHVCPTAYVLVTANDFPNRDPVRWRLEGSANGRDWHILDDRSSTDQNVLLTRCAATEPFRNGAPPPLTDQEQIVEWSKRDFRRPQEFAGAAASICIVPELIGSSRLDRKIAMLEDRIRQHPLQEDFQVTAGRIICRAFHLGSVHQAYAYCGSDPGGLSHGHFHKGFVVFYKRLEHWQKPLLHAALREMLMDGSTGADDLKVLSGLLLRASRECHARKHDVFMLAIDRVSEVSTTSEATAITDLERHQKALFTATQTAIDDLKEKAFKSVFTEPTKMYFHAVGNATMEGDVEVHGSNTYLALLLAALGVKLPRSPLLSDETKGIAAYRDALRPRDVEMLCKPENVGKSWHFVIGSDYPNARRIAANRFFFRGRTPRQLANHCLSGSSGPARNKFKPYLDAFAHYFSENVVVERLCNCLLSDDSLTPSLNTIFKAIAPAGEVEESDGQARIWLWDLMTGDFRQDRAVSLLRFAGIIRTR